jgi:hypothetical protein
MARDMTIVVDLGTSKAVERVEVHAQGGGAAAIEYPERVAVAVSENGAAWKPAAASTAEPEEQERRESGGRCAALGWLKIATPNAFGRYVRLQITPKGGCAQRGAGLVRRRERGPRPPLLADAAARGRRAIRGQLRAAD